MKKLLLFIVIPFLFTGCYDYIEINDRAIVSGMAVTYKDNKYEISLEIINAKKGENNQSQTNSIIISGTGKTPASSINNTLAKVNKNTLFSHLQIVLLDESVAKRGIKDISNYLFRDIHISHNFYYVLAKETDAKNILKVKLNNEKIVTNAILDLFNNSNDIELLDYSSEFDDLYAQLKNGKSDIIIPSVTLNNKNIILGSAGIFKNDKLVDYLTKKESQTYYLLKSKIKNSLFYTKDTAISIYENKSKFKVNDNTINISLDANAVIKCLNEKTNLRNGSKNNELSGSYSKILKKNIKNLIEKSIESNSDFLGFNTIFYEQNPHNYNKNIYKLLNYKISVNLEVNRNGQAYEVID